MKSDNGSSWTQTYDISGGATLEGITYGNNIFVGVGYTSSYKTWILISSDGSNWASSVSGEYSGNLQDVTYGNNLFITVGSSGTILTSPDGTSWTSRTSGTTQKLLDVTYYE